MRNTLLPWLWLFAILIAPASGQEVFNRRVPKTQIRYPLGPDSLPQANVPKGRLEGPVLFRSKFIENTIRKYWVYVPAQYDPQTPAAVLVFQDGARAINPEGVLRVPQVLENLIAKKQIPVTIGVFITPGQRGTEFPDSIGTGNPNNRDREYDVLNDAYARMVLEEILPEVASRYNLSKDPASRAIGGSSSGAICAFTVAWERPNEFRNVISLIGSFTNIHGGHVYPDLIRAAEKKPIRIFLQDGVDDLRNPGDLDRDWYLQNQKMVAAFQEKGYDMAHVFGEGGHSDDHGGAILPLMLRWIWRDHPGVIPVDESELVEAARSIAPERSDPLPGHDPQAKLDPSGVYSWVSSVRNVSSKSRLSLSVKEGKIHGTLEIQRGEDAPTSTEIENVSLEGNKLIFDASVVAFQNQPVRTSFFGIVSEKGIEGWRLSEFGGQPRDVRWTAVREIPPANAPEPVTMTTQEDHQQMLKQLGITKLRPGRNANASSPNAANYDEALANPYPDLPEILRLNDGQYVTTVEEWWTKRRPEIVADFEREVLGRVPADVPSVRWELLETVENKVGEIPVTEKRLQGVVDNSRCPAIEVKISMTVVTPTQAVKPVPLLMMFGFNFAGRGPPVKENSPPRPPVPSRTQQLIEAGWGYATIVPNSIQADNGAGLTRGIIGLTNRGQPRRPDDWGALRAWAWGASRGLDYLETDRAVDAKRVGIEGVSRYGKAALVAMAFDTRFAMALVGSSGEGGAKLHRRNFGEAVENLTSSGEYHWMAGNFLKYGAEESSFGRKDAGDLPVDAHQLLGLCAPRLTFVSYGVPEKGDALWLDQQGSFMATVAAGSVYRLLGAKDLGITENYRTAKMPSVNVGLLDGALAWRQHDGGHTDGPNIPHFIQWVENHHFGAGE